ncbi:MAG: ribosome assembly RNA-binding protein YhbY [Clostridiales bacterium]|nr:ribosome assembly RNA-binding protein YhbY [Clostridiales bacterium]MCD7872907.1 ribosome assembly RNA-binding protein YhbY [Clostridiales bacterium]
MTSKERAALRAKANPLEPIFQIGKDGISKNLILQLDDALDSRELLKIRVHLETAPQTPKEFANDLASELSAEVIQVIGGIIVLYRKADKEKINEKKLAAAKAAGKKISKKKVKIKGMRQRQREYEEAHPWVKYQKQGRRNK